MAHLYDNLIMICLEDRTKHFVILGIFEAKAKKKKDLGPYSLVKSSNVLPLKLYQYMYFGELQYLTQDKIFGSLS